MDILEQATPDGWSADGENVTSRFHGGQIILRGNLADTMQNRANAQIAPAARDLLKAAIEITRIIAPFADNGLSAPHMVEAVRKLRAAINKAQGEG